MVRHGNSLSSARARSLSCPNTTSTGLSPAAAATRTARRSTVSPSISRKSLFFPMRLEVPDASRTQPMSALLMDAPALHPKAQRLAISADREHLGHDTDRYLLRALAAHMPLAVDFQCDHCHAFKKCNHWAATKDSKPPTAC